jgi:hypothetical protein
VKKGKNAAKSRSFRKGAVRPPNSASTREKPRVAAGMRECMFASAHGKPRVAASSRECTASFFSSVAAHAREKTSETAHRNFKFKVEIRNSKLEISSKSNPKR